MKRILVVEDDFACASLVRRELENNNFKVTLVQDGSQGLSQMCKSPPDLAVIDVTLPSLSGFEICRQARKDPQLRGIPILILTARSDEVDCVLGLESGADDYVIKPFRMRELTARISALLRRTERQEDSQKPTEIGPLTIDPKVHQVSLEGKLIPVSLTEFRLLQHLANRPNQVFSRDQLLDAVWGTDRFVTPRSVDTYMYNLRMKIESNPAQPRFLKTIRGAGYLFSDS